MRSLQTSAPGGSVVLRTVLFAWSLLPARPALGLDPAKAITQYTHDTWGVDQGLPQNTVLSLAQTDDGYLWVGTEEGLARFDGARFTVFDKTGTDGFTHNAVQGIAHDGAGGLWLATSGGGLMQFQGGHARPFTKADGLSSDNLRALHRDAAGNLWAGSEGGGLNRLKDGKVTVFTMRDGLPSDIVRAVASDRAGDVWVATSAGLARLAKGTITRFGRADGLTSDAVRALDVDAQGNLWIGTDGGGLIRFRDGQFTALTTKDGLASDFVRVIYHDRAGNLWIGTEGGGLDRLTGGKLSHYTTRQGLSDDNIRTILEDREGNLWVGTYAAGLNRLADGKFVTFGTQEGLPHDNMRAILQGRDGTMWFGSYGGGLTRMTRDGVIASFTTKDGLGNDLVMSLAEDTGGAIWIGTAGGGVSRFKGGLFTRFGTAEGLGNLFVRSVYADRKGEVWAGSEGGGLHRLVGDRFTSMTTQDGLPVNLVRAVLRDSKGNLWIGTSGGGLVRNTEGKLTIFTTKDGLASDLIFSLYEDADGTLWIGTYGGGLSRLKNGKITSYTARKGLFNDVVYVILEDGARNLWLSSNKGVSRVSKRELDALADGKTAALHPTVYGKSDGLRSGECNGGSQSAGTRGNDGRLWFPTIKGAAVIDPEHIVVNRQPPPVHIEEVLVDRRVLDVGASPRLPPDSERFEFHYTALSLVAPERVPFRYKLEGFDRKWIDVGSQRVAYYTSIRPGSYTFRVEAANNDGVWNTTGASWAFQLQPHLYETAPFYGLVAVLVAFVGAAGYRVRVRSLRRREKELVELVESRTRELGDANRQLAEANLVLERISYLDDLTGIANRRQLDKILEVELRRSHRDGSPLSFIMIDIDSFKAFNDSYGHQKGDEALKRVAAVLSHELRRPADCVGRYGGEEFAIILPATDRKGATAVAERMRREVELVAMPHEHSTAGTVVTISLGVASTAVEDGATVETLVSAADRALYEAKSAGRNRVKIALPGPAKSASSTE